MDTCTGKLFLQKLLVAGFRYVMIKMAFPLRFTNLGNSIVKSELTFHLFWKPLLSMTFTGQHLDTATLKYCFVMVVGSFQLKNAFSETGYPAFY